MKEYIEREAIIKLSKEIQDNFAPLHRKVIDAFVYNIDKNIPAADVEPVRHGEWICETNKHNYFEFHCSLCGRVEEKEEPYCHCGAKMDGGNSNG